MSCSVFFYAGAEDSIPAKELNEIVVVGDRGWVENDKIIFIPSRKEKQLANSPETLIKSMHLPMLKEKDGAIISLSGETVTIFINGIKADKIDLSTFWPKDAKRVEYLESPSDPKFEGAKHVVNFIMAQYTVGGVSKLDANQNIPGFGYYSASTKLVHKKMTYGFLATGYYTRDHRTVTKGTETYKNLFYEGDEYDEIDHEADGHSYERDNALNFALNARYITDLFQTTHTVSLGWSRNPGSGSGSSGFWSPDLFGSSLSADFSSGKSLSPQVSGNYYSKLSDKWYLSGSWAYQYARNQNNSWSETGNEAKITNENREEVHSLNFAIQPYFALTSKLRFQYRIVSALDWFSARYSGSANTKQGQARQEISSSLAIHWRPSRILGMSLSPGISATLWKVGEIRQHTVRPTTNASINWNPNSKFALNGALRFYMRPPAASESNPVSVRSSELLWVKGNPYLKDLTSWDTYINSTYIASNSFSLGCGLGYVRTYNSIAFDFIPAPQETGGLIKNTINTKPCDNLRAHISLNGSLLNDRLSVSLSPQWYYTKVRGIYADNLSYLTFSGSIDYTVSDFRFELWYDGAQKDLSYSGMERSWQQDNWNASITYGNGNIYMSLRLEDIFNDKSKSWTKFNSKHYISSFDKWVTGRTLKINLTWTFGYGKNVDRSIDISAPGQTKTSIVN